MIVFGVIVFLLISIISLLELCFIKEFFNKILSFYYFLTNFIAFMLVYFVYSNKFGFIVEMIFPLIILNMIIILLIIKNKINNTVK